MNTTSTAAVALLPPLAGSALLALRDKCGIEKANCHSCARGHADNDGEPGATYYCGMECGKHNIDGTYLEDVEIDPDTEKSCWEPEFWIAQTPEIEASHPIDGSSESVEAAIGAFVAFCKPYLQNA